MGSGRSTTDPSCWPGSTSANGGSMAECTLACAPTERLSCDLVQRQRSASLSASGINTLSPRCKPPAELLPMFPGCFVTHVPGRSEELGRGAAIC